ncbi:MAG: hydantoinase/oxoprolinase family protein [Streptosporangiales bacterium]|nr:hydantoinase/oxoprolinase family protein [Streptosporangiales bacterium]
MPKYHLGIDVGGTFTDAVLVSLDDGSVSRCKVRTTPEDQSVGVLDAISEFDISPSDISMFSHGNTVAINALLERKGPKTGLICTEGTRDMLDMGGLVRPPGDELYDATWTRPHLERPLVHRRYIRDIRERLISDGSVHVGLDEDSVRKEVQFLKDEGVESVAICLLHAYVNPAHENRVEDIVREVMPDAYVQASSIRPVIGELDRTFTVVLNAYTGPVIGRYLNRLRDRLKEIGYDGDVLVTQMNGGVRTLERTIEELPGYTIQSGPTAGLLGAEAYAREILDEKNFLCVDIGGTSTDIGLVDDGQALKTDDWELEFGIRLGFPALDVRSIGAGGGSIIQLDELGTLRIGPESAGAVPGPASYGRGGIEPAITDALVAMGIVQPELFLDGRMELSRDAAVAALETVAEPLSMTALELACGVFDLMNAQIEQETSKIIFERAVDPKDFVLLAYGGAGPVHAASIARIAGISRVVIPYFPGGFSALGMVVAPLRAEHAVSVVGQIDVIGPERLQEIFEKLGAQVTGDLTSQGVDVEDVTIERSLHGHYVGQGFANRIPFTGWPVTTEAIEEWKQGFHAFYDKSYGYSAPESPIEVTTMTVSGSGRPGRMPVTRIPSGGAQPDEDALVMVRDVCLDGRTWQQMPFYHRTALRAGNRIEGPAVVDDGLSTILVTPESTASVDDYGDVIIDIRA